MSDRPDGGKSAETQQERFGLGGRAPDGPGALSDLYTVRDTAREEVRQRSTNPKTEQGLKKPPLDKIPGVALVHMSLPMGDGAEKYGPRNWRESPVEASIYVAAALRHISQFMDGEFWDPESKSGASHLGAAMASIAVLLDAMYQGTWIDDRGKPGRVPELIRAFSFAQHLPEPLTALVPVGR